MLIRILSDNPGPSFTRNLDPKFANTVKNLLRDGRDMGVQQLLRETLESLAIEKASDPNLVPLLEMWKKEKDKVERQLKVSIAIQIPSALHIFLCSYVLMCHWDNSRPHPLHTHRSSSSRTTTPANFGKGAFPPLKNSHLG
jgi:hypothetical protein